MGLDTGVVGGTTAAVGAGVAVPLVNLPFPLLLPLLVTTAGASGVAVVAVITLLLLPGFGRDLFIVLLSSSETFSSSLSILFRGETCCWWDEENRKLLGVGRAGVLLTVFATRTVNCCTIAASSRLLCSSPRRFRILKSLLAPPFSTAPLVLASSEDVVPFTFRSIASSSEVPASSSVVLCLVSLVIS